MSRILIADTAEAMPTLNRILLGHDCIEVSTMNSAMIHLKSEAFDLIVVALHFDDSQMFELIREVKKCPKNVDKPIICFCSRETPMSRLMHESLECSTKALGAWMYLEEHAYNVYKNPDAELRRVIDRCLTAESRKEIQQQRVDIQRQRADLQKLRLLLQEQEWSLELNEYLGGVKHDLVLLLKEVTRLHLAADAERASVVASRGLKDRVTAFVIQDENDMASTEEMQTATENKQSLGEEELTAKEVIKKSDAGHNALEKLEKN